MGYTTTFEGEFRIAPALTDDDRAALAQLVGTQPAGAPDRHCGWEPSEDGSALRWDGSEKFSDYAEWATFLVTTFLVPKGYKLTGEVRWQGEEDEDRGVLRAEPERVVAEGEPVVIDPQQVKQLRALFQNPKPAKRLVGFEGVFRLAFATRSRELIPILTEGLVDPEPKNRVAVVHMLGGLLSQDEPSQPTTAAPFTEGEIAPFVRRMMSDVDDRVRVACVVSLRRVSDAAADLERLATNDPSAYVRNEASYALCDHQAMHTKLP